jgi:hypothetical protein
MSDGLTEALKKEDDKLTNDSKIIYYDSKIEMLERRLNTINKLLLFCIENEVKGLLN